MATLSMSTTSFVPFAVMMMLGPDPCLHSSALPALGNLLTTFLVQSFFWDVLQGYIG